MWREIDGPWDGERLDHNVAWFLTNVASMLGEKNPKMDKFLLKFRESEREPQTDEQMEAALKMHVAVFNKARGTS